MIASAHLLLAGVMVGVACEGPAGMGPPAAAAVAVFNFCMFMYRMTAPMESLD